MSALNPFALGGPAFLLFYLVLMAVTFIVLRRAMRAAETAAAPPAPKFEDPYLIAWLRGGEKEAIRVATVSLVDRGLLAVDGDKLSLPDLQAVELVRRDIERAVLRAYRSPGDAERAAKDSAVRQACRQYKASLERHGLVAGRDTFTRRGPQIAIAAAVLLGTSAVRIGQALLHGHHNLVFLGALTLIAAVALIVHWRRPRTFAGDAAIADLETLFKRLKDRAAMLRPGSGGNEVAMLAAVFGLAALPAGAFPYVATLYPRPPNESSGGGSSDSSSCGSSCGGGCGGGGCGGE